MVTYGENVAGAHDRRRQIGQRVHAGAVSTGGRFAPGHIRLVLFGTHGTVPHRNSQTVRSEAADHPRVEVPGVVNIVRIVARKLAFRIVSSIKVYRYAPLPVVRSAIDRFSPEFRL